MGKIKSKLIYVDTRSNFDILKGLNVFEDKSIIFIGDTLEFWTHNKMFNTVSVNGTSWGSSITVNGQTLTIPENPNTDILSKWTSSTSGDHYIAFSPTTVVNNNAYQNYYNSNLKYNAATGNFQSTKFNGYTLGGACEKSSDYYVVSTDYEEDSEVIAESLIDLDTRINNLNLTYVEKNSVTGGGSTWGSSISVDGKTLTIPSNPIAGYSILNGTLADNSSQIPTSHAVYTAIANSFTANDAMRYKGLLAGSTTKVGSTTVGTYTPAGVQGDTYKVSTAGYINGVKVEIGDMLVCVIDTAAAAVSTSGTTQLIYTTAVNNWNYILANLDPTTYVTLTGDLTIEGTKTFNSTITGSISGNAGTATSWQNARTLTIGNTGKKVNGSGDVSWTLAEIGVSSSTHSHGNITNDGKIGTTKGYGIFTDTAGLLNTVSNVYWDSTNNRLGINTTSPGYSLTVSGNGASITSTGTNGLRLASNSPTIQFVNYNSGSTLDSLAYLASGSYSWSTTEDVGSTSSFYRINGDNTAHYKIYDSGNFTSGTGANNWCAGNDSRLSDSRIANGGNSDTVDNKHSFDFMLNFTSSNYDLNELKTSGAYRLSGSPINAPANLDYGLVLVFNGNGGDTVGQLAASYKGTDWYIRSGTWYAAGTKDASGNPNEGSIRTRSWDKILTSGNSSVSKSGETLTVNINGTSQSLANTWRPLGTGATDAAAGNHTHDQYATTSYYWANVRISSTSSTVTVPKFNYIQLTSNSTNWNFSRNTERIDLIHTTEATNATGALARYYGGLSAISGYVGFQLITFGGNTDDLKFRKLLDNGTWHDWYELIHSGNISSQSVSHSTTTNGIFGVNYSSGDSNIIKAFWNTKSDNRWYLQSADAAYLCRVEHSTSTSRLGENSSTTSTDPGGLTWYNTGGTAGCAVNINDAPTSAWWYILRNRHTDTSNNYYTDVAIPFNDSSIYYKIVRNNSLAASPYNKWVKVYDENNFTSGTGASNWAAGNHTHYQISKTNLTIADGTTVANAKTAIYDAIKSYSGIGRNVVVSDSIINNWGTDTATQTDNSVATITAINSGYNGETYGQYLVASWNHNRLGILRYISGFESIEWFSKEGHSHTLASLGAQASGSYLNYSSKSVEPGKGVRIQYPSGVPIIIGANRNNGNGQLLLVGSGYGGEGTVRNKFTEVVSCAETTFTWSLPASASLERCIEIMHHGSSTNATIYVYCVGSVTFTDITALSTTKLNAPLAKISDIPTNNNLLTNGAGYITASSNITGTAAGITGKTLVTSSSVCNSGWSTYASNHIPTMSFIAYWNGAYSGTSSNLTYCNKGAFGTAAIHAHEDYVTSIGTSGNTLTWAKGGIAQTAITVPYATNADTVDSVHLEWSGSQAASSTSWLAGWTSDGTKIKAVSQADLSVKNADTVDGEHASAFAKVTSYNDLIHSGNEFTFASSAFSGTIWINYRTASGTTNGNITDYNFGNGKGGALTSLSTLITNSSNGNTAYSWGDHGLADYLVKSTGGTVGGPTSFTSTLTSSGGFSSSGVSTFSDTVNITTAASTSSTAPLSITNNRNSIGLNIVLNKTTDSSGTTFNGTSVGNIGLSISAKGYNTAGRFLTANGTAVYAYVSNTSGNNNAYSSRAIYARCAYSSGYCGYFYGGKFNVLGTSGISLKNLVSGYIHTLLIDNSGFNLTHQSGGYIKLLSTGITLKSTSSSSVITINTSGDIQGNNYYTSSDKRLKNIISNPDYSIDDIAKLPIVKYTWNNNKNNEIHLGSIAQEVLKIMPELVNEDSNGNLSLDYATLGTVSSILLAKEIVKLKEEIKQLKEKYGQNSN